MNVRTTTTTAPEPLAISPIDLALADEIQEQSENPTQLICDLSEAEAFIESQRKPHIPVLSAFGADRLHTCRLMGLWDLDRMAGDNANALFRSVRKFPSKDSEDNKMEWDDLTFRFGPKEFVYADSSRIVGFASTPDGAERLVKQFAKKYVKPKSQDSVGGNFFMIQQEGSVIMSREVVLSANTILDLDDLSLHYGRDGKEWHLGFVEKLRSKNNGLSILEGKPGTGKTYYLRHLMGELRESHRFYFIPTGNMAALSTPDFIGFWADQRRTHAKKMFVVILEDSDAALMTRGLDNREKVSALLNLSDGMLADFLRLQIICTINCSVADIDPALLRPGRLLCHRVFNRLDYDEAAKLAESLGKKLPQASDYSLAEVFAGHETVKVSRQHLGFGA